MASNTKAHVVIRSATKFQAPSSRRYNGDLAKAGHLTIKSTSKCHEMHR